MEQGCQVGFATPRRLMPAVIRGKNRTKYVNKATIDNWIGVNPTIPKVTEAYKVAKVLNVTLESLISIGGRVYGNDNYILYLGLSPFGQAASASGIIDLEGGLGATALLFGDWLLAGLNVPIFSFGSLIYADYSEPYHSSFIDAPEIDLLIGSWGKCNDQKTSRIMFAFKVGFAFLDSATVTTFGVVGGMGIY